MSQREPLSVRGFLSDGDTGAGLSGLRVELWDAHGAGQRPIAIGRSDDAGLFRLRVAPNRVANGDGSLFEAELRVVDQGRLLLNEVRELSLEDDGQTLELSVPASQWDAEAEAEVQDAPVPAEVWGQVKGRVAGRARAEAVLMTLSGGSLTEEVIAEAAVNGAGWYRMRYQLPAGPETDTTLRVRLRTAGGQLLAESTPMLAPPRQARVDLRPARSEAEPSEYSLLEQRLEAGLAAGVRALEGAEAQVVEEVAGWLDLEPGRLDLFRQARALEAETGVPAAVFYSLGRSGLGPALEELIDVPRHELRTTLEEAVACEIAGPELLTELESSLEQLSQRILEHALRTDRQTARPGLGDVLATASLPEETTREILRRYQGRTGGEAEFWEDFTEGGEAAEGLDEEISQELQLAVELSTLVGPDPGLLRRMHELRRQGRWQKPEDLAGFSFEDWRELLEELERSRGDAGTGSLEEEVREQVEDHAEAILETLEEAFPSPFIRRELIEAEEVSPGARRLLERVANHDFMTGSIRGRAESEPSLLEGFEADEAEAVLEEVEAVERVSRVTQRAEEVAVLVGSGLRSAMEIAGTPRRHFIELYAESLGGRPQAARVHAQAQQQAAANKLTTIRMLQSFQHVPFVLGAPPEKSFKDIPDASTLFGGSGLCGCEHCSSVYSPAAYFVDLLRYLDTSRPERLQKLQEKLRKSNASAATIAKLGRYQPLDVLLGRRPELAELPLTCENTLTTLPYIDVVNEVLEARVAGTSASFDTGKTPADVLRAVPQNLSRAAYQRLQEAIHPISLPYHQPLALARAYLGHLGVTRLELMQALGRGQTAQEAIVAEALGMSFEEFGHVVRPSAELWRYFGFAAEQNAGVRFVDALTHVPTFLEATGITYQDLVDVVSTRFVNADNGLHLDSPTPDCDPAKVSIAGLDEPRLSRMLRLVRLQRRLGWKFADLDRVLFAFGATELDAAVLAKIADVRELARKLDRPVTELLVLWAPLDTWGKDSQFDRLLTTRAVMWRTQDERTFRLRPDRTELIETGESLDAVASALLAGFRITSDELALVRAVQARRGTQPRLDLAGLSAVYRVVLLARALQLRIEQLDLLLRLIPPEADPFREPAATLRFVELVREVQASDFTPEKLAYLFRHETEPRRDPGPLPAQVEAVLTSIRRALADAFVETSPPTEASGEALRQKLAVLLEPALLDAAMEVLDPRTSVPLARRREFFDRHLARIFPDPAAAAARLFEAPAPSPLPMAPPPPASLPAAEPEDQAALPVSPAEQRWRGNVLFVLEHLLPQLRSRQMRGAVVQSLSDTLGLSVPSTARLLDGVLRSRRRPGEPLIRDFLALVGTGLTGSYYPNPELQGEPALVRTDATLGFSWAGAAPAENLPGRGFSVRWTGYLLPRSKARHTFYLRTDGAVRLVLKIDGAERVLIDQPGAAGRVVEHSSEPVALDPRTFYELVLEYRNQGAPGTLSLQLGTAPGAKHPVATTELYPSDGLSSFTPVEQSYRRLHKAAMILTGFGMTDAQLEWLTGEPPYLNFDALPMEPSAGTDAVGLFRRWRQLAAIHALRRKLPRSNVDLFEVFRAGTLPEALERLVLATGWDRGVVEAFAGPQGFAIESVAALRPPTESTELPVLLRLARAVDVQRRVGVAPGTLYAWANATPDAEMAAAIVQAVKARYDEKRWLEVARSLNDPLRAERRDALVSYLLPRMREQGVKNRNQLFEYFLIDVEMSPCMLTSRIQQAIATVQTFFQRCLMNLERQVHPRLIDDNDWKWLKNYRVWEANRKIFLYPENWIEPELRDDKSPLFQDFERSILQQEIKKENVESAFASYLEGLDEIARLDVRSVWFEPRERAPFVARQKPEALRVPAPPWSKWEHGTYHVFARTFNAPHVWYYRRLENGREWTPWEKIEADIETEHLVPVIFHRRLHLFWTVFREVSKPVPKLKKDEPPPTLGKDWEIHLAYTLYDRGRWSRKRMSSAGMLDVQTFVSMGKSGPQIDGSRILPQGDYTLRATVSGKQQARPGGVPPNLRLHLYRRKVDLLRSGLPRAAFDSLEGSEVELVGVFQMDGCSGALSPDRTRATGRAEILGALQKSAGKVNARIANSKRARPSHPFRLNDGGVLNAPSGYRVDGMGFATTRKSGGSLLALRPSEQHGLGQVLGAPRSALSKARLLPVIDSQSPESQGLFPFFFQDRFRTYFVRPVYADWKPPRLVAVPLVGRKALPPPLVRPGRPSPRRGAHRGGRGRREELEALEAFEAFEGPELAEPVASEALDEWEQEQDEAWHPEDAAENRRRQRRGGGARRPPPPPAPRPATLARAQPAAQPQQRFELKRQGGYHEQKLRFVAFEHPATCRLLSTLKARGTEGLLEFSTSRPRQGTDHILKWNGEWARRKDSWFQHHYRPGPLVDPLLPHLDIDFAFDNPYALYNWELFFHAPFQVAIRLSKEGRHEEAQRWFHFIFDPTTDASSPAPQRYWRFAPFHENKEFEEARQLMALLSYSGKDQQLIARQNQVRDQVSAWWEKPFSPHVLARLRIVAYQKAVVMKYIDNLIEWGDKLFRRDSMESINEATQLYILAGNILGPRPEKIPPMVETEPLTFKKMRQRLDLFSNFEVRLENHQVRRPFRINARPEVGAATSVLGMATQYFCTPANPQLDKYWDTVADRLFKIRNCMNIQGVVRQLPLFEPPIDPGLLVRAAAAGVDLGSVIASLNAPPPHFRFRFLVSRAVRLAEELRSFGMTTLQVLERRDAEGLASLRASNEASLLETMREIRKKQVKQVEEQLEELTLEREHVEIKAQHITTQMQELMNPQEAAKQASLTAAQVLSGIAEGADLISKVMHAIPDFQTGTAGGFSSPFVTLQLGGQALGEISSAFGESIQKIMNGRQSEADMAEAQAEYQRRRAEWQHELELLNKEKAQVDKRMAEVRLKLDISTAELRRHETETDNARKVEAYLRDKYTNEQLYGWMLGQLSGVYFQAYKFAFDAAQQAERAYRFERGEPAASFIEFSYWDSLKKGLFAGERLLLDLRRMEAAHLEGDRRALEISRHISLREDHPSALQELLATGRCQVEVTEALLDGDFPGHYFRRVRSASLTMAGPLRPHSNVNCTLTLLENRIRTSANASGTYAQSEDADDSRFLVNFAPVQAVATSRPSADAGVFELRFDDERYLPFEGAGAISTWRIDLKQADNAVDLSQLNDVVLTLAYTARTGGAALESAARASREKGLARGGAKPVPQHLLSLKRDLPDVWKRLSEAAAGQEVEALLPLEPGRFSGRYRGLELRVERVVLFAHARGTLAPDSLRLRLDPPKGSGVAISGWAAPWSGSRTLRASAEVAGGTGTWKLGISATGGKLPELVDDLVLLFELRARKA